MSRSGAFVFLAMLGCVACNRPDSQTDASRDDPPSPKTQMIGERSVPQFSTNRERAETEHDAYVAARESYRAALDKAERDHRSALANCETLSKAAQKSCRADADEHLKLTKNEAKRLKPAT